MQSPRSRLRWLGSLILVLAVLLPAPGRAERIALLVGEDTRSIQAARQGVEAVEGSRVTVFELFQGLTAVDEARTKLRRIPFQGVVALGNRAHEFYRSLKLRGRYSSTLLLGVDEASQIPFEADPESWMEILEALFPETEVVASVARNPAEVPSLLHLRTALEARGRRLHLEIPRSVEDVEEAAARAVRAAPVFFLPRDRGLLKRKVLLRLLKEAHANRVAVLGFSKAFVQAGALLALEVQPRDLGHRAGEVALGRDPSPLPTQLYLNEKRAEYLGIEVPDSLRERLR